MNNELIQKAKAVYKSAKANGRKLRKELGIHPATTAAETKAHNCNALAEAYVAMINMSKVNPHAKPLIAAAEKKLSDFLVAA